MIGKEVEICQIQKQFWVLQHVYRNNTAYNIASVLKLNGQPDINAIEHAINRLIIRHESLKVFFREKNSKVYQVSINKDELAFKIDVVKIPEPIPINGLPGAILNEVHRVFNLSEWPLFRIKLFAFIDGTYLLAIVFHHIIIDSHSKRIFSEEFSALYNSFCNRNSTNLSNINSNYSDYAKWERKWMESDDYRKMSGKWRAYIPKTPEILEIPSDYSKRRINNLDGKRIHFDLDEKTSFKIREFAKENSVIPFTVLLTSYSILLNRLTNQQDIIIGVPLTNRRKSEFKEIFGCMVNIVPVLINFNEKTTGIELLKQVRMSLLYVHRMQEVPFLMINNLLRNKRSNSILQAGFTFEPPMNLSLNGLDVQSLVVEKGGAQLDLFFTLWDQIKGFSGYLEYSTQLFRENTAKRFIEIYKKIVEALIENPDAATTEMDILSDAEARMIYEWNNTDHKYTSNICLHDVFEQQVQKTPGNPALLFGLSSMTYSEFDQHTNRLANHLIDSGVMVEDIICVCMERSPELFIAIYAVHKAGSAYMPVAPDYPPERIEMILSDAKPKLVLTNKKSDINISPKWKRIYLDNILASPLSDNNVRPVTDVNSTNLAYVLYTSGSTGKPKGVMIEHHSVINKLEWMQSQHPLNYKDTIMLKTPVTFDVSVWELFWWMFNGASVAILPPGGEKDPKTIIEEVESKSVTTIVFVPSMFAPFVSYVKANNLTNRLSSLKWIIQIGEALNPQLVRDFNMLLTPEFNPLMVNTYGPTEATVAVSWYDCPKEIDIEKIYIGKPIFNTRLLVLNQKNKIQPVGIPGELIITGANLSRGYLNRPELNSEKFIEFKYLDGRKLIGYKTGDIVKWTAEGNIDFIGRADSQVKIRGYRIELGDIESKLLDFPKIKAVAVVVNQSNPDNKNIVGYVVLKKAGISNIKEIRKYLASRLPEYMIPSHLMILEELPLNTSGKIDRKALPEPVFLSNEKFVAPTNSYEKRLKQVWENVLGLKDVSVTNNFFDIGGNSLLAISMVSEIKEQLDIYMDPIHVLEYSSIRRLAQYLSDKDRVMEVKREVLAENTETRKQGFSRLQKRRSKLS